MNRGRALAVAAAAGLMAAAVPARAALVETVTVSNGLGYTFSADGSFPSRAPGGTREQVFTGQRAPTQSDLGVDLVGEAGSGSFYFLHNDYCVGGCALASSTVITFSVTNTGTDAVDLRFDSLITPGHLAIVDGAPGRGGFSFSVTQRTAGQQDATLYSAFGNVSDEEVSVGDGNFNGEPFRGQTFTDYGFGRVLDWSTTPLNLELGSLAAGATTEVEYNASYFVTAFGECSDINSCNGLQVVFGDPRNNGSVSSFARGLAIGDPVTLINREYDAVEVPYAFNLSGSPFPELPPAQGPVTYDGAYDPLKLGAVPEPGTWMTLILGMALVGGALRRDRRRRALAA
ncbi:PEPxxWA-CTERM sorting domain-containing protein [Sphingomonas sp. RHCKR7]|uniref:PEPxxWA-CTERM sorting domain-containing protein n=1 Tax=Sphingomonas folli TaxID=2862497 RepID=UPI001CA5C81B|nr:PEPxxWA-CTERM sorting domain-containing protein [Sphingomonas folli]MBW6528684.1 PEPxxWA-CTERM sorting domain-containing protein [Sphingomonas folli]